MKKRILSKPLFAMTAATLAVSPLWAQQEPRLSASMYLEAPAKADLHLPFHPQTTTGKRLPVRWGMDVAWLSEQNMRKGINHIGKANLSLVRGSFQTTEPLVDDETLTSNQTSMLKKRNEVANLIGTDVDMVLNEDQEAGIDAYYVLNNRAIVDHWVKLIVASVKWIHQNTRHKVVALSPFNEPDYGWGQGNIDDLKAIAKALKEEPALAGIDITGGNTLNCDQASRWYNYMKPYVDWGNTHQLAGEFDTYASFFAEVKADGNHAYADELHNVGEAMVGAEYGMETAVWWGFDSRARGEFCDISNHGERIAYGELRPQWTSASVYRHDDGRVKIFIGSSERQAQTSRYLFMNLDRPVYFDGKGPTRLFAKEIPGGTSYQKGQTNAECVVDVEWGADVQPHAIDGTYKVMNKATGNLLSQSGDNIDMTKPAANSKLQQWQVNPVDSRVGGDYSFHDFISANDSRHIDVENFSCLDNAKVIAYGNKTPSSNQQWYLVYAGEGYYYIRNRESALYLTSKTKYAVNHVDVVQCSLLEGEARDRQLWRFLPTDAACETVAPAAPRQPQLQAQSASVRLSWEANTESDLEGYMILRADGDSEEWNTIARIVKGTRFTDNTVRKAERYRYCLRAIDHSNNLSALSESSEVTMAEMKAQVGRWHFDGSLEDATENMMDAACCGTPEFQDLHRSGSQSILLNGTSTYLQLPYEVANGDEITIAFWAFWTNSTKQWTRLFDFGNGVDAYLFLTPAADNGRMRLAVKNGGDEQQLECDKMSAAKWVHVAVTIGSHGASIYVNGEEKATTAAISIKPSDIHPIHNLIGKSQFVADPYFRGYIDDLRIFNYALDASEVKALTEDLTNGIHQPEATESAEGMNGDKPAYTLGGRRSHGEQKQVRVAKGKTYLK